MGVGVLAASGMSDPDFREEDLCMVRVTSAKSDDIEQMGSGVANWMHLFIILNVRSLDFSNFMTETNTIK